MIVAPRKSLRGMFSYVLALTLSLQVVYPSRLWAATPEEHLEKANEFANLIRNSEQIPAGQPRGSFAPDRYLLLDQEVLSPRYVGRSFSLFSNAREREIEVHDSRLDGVEKMLEQALGFGAVPSPQACEAYSNIQDLSAAAVRSSLIEHLNEGRRKDIPFFIYHFKNDFGKISCVASRIAEIQIEWKNQIEAAKLVTDLEMKVPNITEAPSKQRTPFISWWEVEVQLVRDGGIVGTFPVARSADYSDLPRRPTVCPEPCEFRLRARGQTIHAFHIPIRNLVTFGPYLVFTHPDSFDPETGIQYLSFIDLMSYSSSLGAADLPVFRLPLELGKPIQNLRVGSRNLEVDDVANLPVQAFAAASEIQRAAFNLTANLTDIKQLAELVPYIRSLESYTKKIVAAELEDRRGEARDMQKAQVLLKELGHQVGEQLEQNKALSQFTAGKKESLSAAELATLPEGTQKILNTYSEGLIRSGFLDERMSAVTKRLNQGRGLKARISALVNKLLTPVPDGSLKVKRALILVGSQRSMSASGPSLRLADRPWLAATVASALAIAAVAPESYVTLLNGSLAISNGIFDYLKFTTLGIWESIKVGSVATFDPIVSLGGSVMDQYVNNGNLEKTLIGLGVFVPVIMSIYYIPHLVFNLHQVVMDYREQKRNGEWKGFVHHQREFVRTYYQRLADDEAKRRAKNEEEQKKISFSKDEEEQIQEYIERRRKPPGFISRMREKTRASLQSLSDRMYEYTDQYIDLDRVKGTWSLLATMVQSEKVQQSMVMRAGKELTSAGSAARTITFSYPAMELTLTRWAKFWNWFAGTRYTSVGFLTLRDLGVRSENFADFPIFIRPKPISAGVRLLMPDFFNTVVSKQGPKMTIPTRLNGGLRGWETRDLTWYKERLFGAAPIRREAEDSIPEELDAQMRLDAETRDLVEEQARLLNASELKAITEDFEAAILPVEKVVFKAGFDGALSRMADFLSNKKELVDLFTRQPIHSVAEKRVRDMPVQVRTFLRVFMDRVYEKTMQDYLSEVLADEMKASPEDLPPDLDLVGLKKRLLQLNGEIAHVNHLQTPYRFDADRAKAIAEKYAHSEEFFNEVSAQARKGEWSVENFIKNRKYNLMGDMDPQQNGSMKRYADVQTRLKSPNALSRAVRAEISKLLVTFPLDLAFHMFFSAAIFEGAFRPIQNELWGENSIFYLSQTSFYMGMAAGFTMSMMADAWMKLQQDSRQDNLNDFGIIPKGQDADESFLRWYGKQFSAKNNSLMDNWAYSNRLSFWNMPAALANYGVFYYMFSGRMDLSLLLGSYPIIFGTPLSALSMKIEQAFERASEYAARGIEDEKWMSHPDIQALISKEKQAYRNKFQLLNDFFLNLKGGLIGNITIIPTSLGPRGFTRAMLGGYLVEELIVNKIINPTRVATGGYMIVGPIMNGILDTCEHLLTNGNPDLTKLHPPGR